MTASAPPAMALITARKPESRPSTSTTMALRCEVVASFMRSITVAAVFSAVSTPMESSVPGMSLSKVAGTPTVGRPSPCSASALESSPLVHTPRRVMYTLAPLPPRYRTRTPRDSLEVVPIIHVVLLQSGASR
jgi:hypothetical protein